LGFIRNLRKKHGKGPIAIYADNLMVHKCNDAMALYRELDILMIWAPAYSPEYNPIEYIFSKLKGASKKMRLNDMMKDE
jgi:transposase